MRKRDIKKIPHIMTEVISAFELLADIGPAISIFGSARTDKENQYYKDANETGKLLAEDGYAIITGGGPGIMEAANKGAAEVEGSDSIGLRIDLPFEQGVNEYVSMEVPFYYFFTRKYMFIDFAKACICFPGGYGTLDELFEILQIVQTGKFPDIPIMLYSEEYWKDLIEWFKKTLLKNKNINKKDLEMFTIVNSPEEVLKVIQDFYSNA